MTRFRETLKLASDRLDLPQPTKSRILLEIASDLDAAYEHFRAQGLEEEEAVRKTTERFQLSDEVLAQLAQIHRTPFRRLLDRLSTSAQSRWERLMLLLLLLFIAGMAGRHLQVSLLASHVSPFVWPALGLALVALGLGLHKGYVLFLKKDHNLRHLRSGLHPLLALAGVDLGIGAYGWVFELHAAAGRVARGAEPLVCTLDWLLRTSGLMLICLPAALGTALAWFALTSKAGAIERAEIEHQLGGDDHENPL